MYSEEVSINILDCLVYDRMTAYENASTVYSVVRIQVYDSSFPSFHLNYSRSSLDALSAAACHTRLRWASCDVEETGQW